MTTRTCGGRSAFIAGQMMPLDLSGWWLRTARVMSGEWTIKDEGTNAAPSMWRTSNNALLQLSNIGGGTYPVYPGTYVIAGDPEWTDYRMTVGLRSDDDDALGIMFRYTDPDNYYRLSVDNQKNLCMLTSKKDGTVKKLDEKKRSYNMGDSFTLTVDMIGERIICYMGEQRLFDVTDASHKGGKIGLYCWSNDGTRFEHVEVLRPSLEAIALFKDRFAENNKADWTEVDEGTRFGPSNWATQDGALRQTSNIHSPSTPSDQLSRLGTHAVAGIVSWTDVIVSVRMRSIDNDAMGLLFRYSDKNHYYRFSMDSSRKYRRLVKNNNGRFTKLWEDDFAYNIGQTYEVTILAFGSILRGYLDGVPMFVVEDGDLASGRVGLYCWANDNTQFSQVRVFREDLAFDNWLIDETFEKLCQQSMDLYRLPCRGKTDETGLAGKWWRATVCQ
jgi:hypothetical protein